MLIKVGNDLFRLLELHHLTPGNKRAHIQVRMRNIRTLALADHKFRAEEDVERATLDEREMQYLYNDGDTFYFMDTTTFDQVHISSEALGDSKDYLVAEMLIRVEFYDDRGPGGEGNGARHQGRDRQQSDQAGHARNRSRHPGAAIRQRRRQGPRQHRNRRIPVPRLNGRATIPAPWISFGKSFITAGLK
jgi:translation elongation factor P/translation initiation factor 5A